MKKLVFLFLFVACTLCVRSQVAYIPNKGSVVMFYPVSDEVRQMTEGYDFAYYTNDAYKNGKIINKPKFRFKKNENDVTPFEEIENHTFTILDYIVENKDSKRYEKKAFICFLKRDDGELLFIRIPYIAQPNDNIITKSFCVQYDINMPCCDVESYKYIQNSFVNQEIVNYPEVERPISAENRVLDKKDKELFRNHTKYLGSELPEYFGKRYGTVMLCDDVSFLNIDGYVFKQPVCRFIIDNKKTTLPMFDLRGAGKSSYGTNYTILQFFTNKKQLLSEKMKELSEREFSIVGDTLFYAKEIDSKYSYGAFSDAMYIKYRNSENTYKVKSNIPYKCIGIDLANQLSKYFPCPYLNAILIDPDGTEIQVPFRVLAFKEKYDYGEMFRIASEEKARNETRIKEKEKEQKELDEKIAKYSTKYGREGAKVIAKGYCTEEDYVHWKKQYGERTAVMIAEGLYDVGFPKSAFYVAIKKDYIKLIASYNDQSGSYEVIQHREFNPKYVTFRNGKIISITDFY